MPLRLGRPQAVVACLLLSLTSFVSPSFQYESVEHSEEREFYNGVGTEHISDGGGISKIDGLLQGMGQPKERQKNLTCHVCYSERDPLCFNLSSLYRPVGDSDDVDTDNEIQRHWSRKGDFNGFPLQCKNESYICSVRISLQWNALKVTRNHFDNCCRFANLPFPCLMGPGMDR